MVEELQHEQCLLFIYMDVNRITSGGFDVVIGAVFYSRVVAREAVCC